MDRTYAKYGQITWTEAESDLILSMWAEGYPKQQIADRMGVAPETIRRFLERNGVTATGRGAFGRFHHHYGGGRIVNVHGYVLVLTSEMEAEKYGLNWNKGYVLEHRLVMARSLARALRPGETVHHINGDKQDNRIENLQLRQGKHGNGVSHRCADCGSVNIEAVPLAK